MINVWKPEKDGATNSFLLSSVTSLLTLVVHKGHYDLDRYAERALWQRGTRQLRQSL